MRAISEGVVRVFLEKEVVMKLDLKDYKKHSKTRSLGKRLLAEEI